MASNSLKTLYDSRLVPISQLNMIVRFIDENRMSVSESINGDQVLVLKRMAEIDKRISKNREEY